MAISTIDVVMTRVSAAAKGSPIAVFIPHDSEPDLFEAVFADTFETQRRIKEKDPLYIGTFHKGMRTDEVSKKLRMARRMAR